jgi:hypothetical protein
LGIKKVLEISTKSPSPLGVSLSAFNLNVRTVRRGREFVVESAYQGSKVFEYGGPYKDLVGLPAKEAKRDPRLSSSGRLTGFHFLGIDWPLEPETAFYDWLYVNALKKQPKLLKQAVDYSAFTDIAFNPQRSISCQAHSAALCVSLYHRGLLTDDLATREGFLNILTHSDKRAILPSRIYISNSDLDASMGKKTAWGKARDETPEQFSDMEFHAWHSVATLKSLLSRWLPRPYKREEDFEDSLYRYLQRELPDVQVKKQFSEGLVRADLAIADSVLVEVKNNLDSQTEYRQLWDEIATWRNWDGSLILLLTGKVDPVLVKALQKKVKAWTRPPVSEPKVTIIRK